MKAGTLLSLGTGLVAIGGGSALASRYIFSTTLIDVLKEKKHTFLSFKKGEDLDQWKTIAKAYKTGKNKLGGLTITLDSKGDANEEDAEKLRKTCEDTINSKNYSNEALLAAEQWCVKPITIKDLIKNHRAVLNLETNSETQDTEWDGKVTNYLKPDAKNRIISTKLTAITPNNKKEQIKALKEDCSGIVNKHTYDVDFHDNYAQFNDWCTIAK